MSPHSSDTGDFFLRAGDDGPTLDGNVVRLGLGFRISGLRLRVWGLEFRV